MTFSEHPFVRLLGSLLVLLIVALLAFLFVGWPTKTQNPVYGVTFSPPYAEELGLDPNHVLTVALDEIGIRRFRIPAYMSAVEAQRGQWDWTDLDHIIDEIGKRHGTVVLAIGEKLPRWPECWTPTWWKQLDQTDQQKELLVYEQAVVERYRNNPTVSTWQVENEPHFAYGACPKLDQSFIQEEAAFVHGLDPGRQITTTDSGELSLWTGFGPSINELGISVYRVVRNPIIGNLNWQYWFIPPYFYEHKALLASLFGGLKRIYVSEFQMEPWSNQSIETTPINDQLSSMNAGQMKANFDFAQRMGVTPVDFWGLEWWIWMRDKQNHPEFVDGAKAFWQAAQASQ